MIIKLKNYISRSLLGAYVARIKKKKDLSDFCALSLLLDESHKNIISKINENYKSDYKQLLMWKSHQDFARANYKNEKDKTWCDDKVKFFEEKTSLKEFQLSDSFFDEFADELIQSYEKNKNWNDVLKVCF